MNASILGSKWRNTKNMDGGQLLCEQPFNKDGSAINKYRVHPFVTESYRKIMESGDFEQLIMEQGWLDSADQWNSTILAHWADQSLAELLDKSFSRLQTPKLRWESMKLRGSKWRNTKNMDGGQLLCEQPFSTTISAMMMLSPGVNAMHRVAVHEAGHAAACARNKDCTRVLMVTAAAGVDVNGMHYHGRTDIRARRLYNRNQMLAHMDYYVGSIVAEIIFFDSFYGRGAQCDLAFAHLAAELIVCFLEDDGLKTVEFNFQKRCELPRRNTPEIIYRIGQHVVEAERRVFAAYEDKQFKDLVEELALNVYNAEDKTLQEHAIYTILNKHPT